MRLEDMKQDIPETPKFIHEMIQDEVKKQLQDTKVINIQPRRVKKWTCARVAAAVAVCVLAVSGIAYAGGKLYHMFTEKEGAYSITTGIKADDNAGEMTLPEKIHGIDISAGYIPEGMEWTDEVHLEYPAHEKTGGFSFASVLLDEDDLSKAVQDKNVVDCEERTFGNYEGVYLKYNELAEGGVFNQRIYLLCPEVYRVMTVYIGDDVTKEDAIKMAESLVITENDTVVKTDDLETWSEMAMSEEASGETASTAVAENKLPIHQIGKAFDISASGEDKDGNYITGKKVSVCVDSVQVKDDLSLLDPDNVPKEWARAVGTDGKLVTNTLSYIKSGDGVDSVDKVVKKENVKQKLVYATVTYTNKSEKKINHMLYIGALMLMNHEDGKYRIYDPAGQSGKDYDHVIWDGVADTAEMTYSSVSEDYGNGKNYITSLKPGESVQVDMAWIVNENDLGNMYLNLNGDGAAYEFSDSMLKAGLVDICQ